MSRAADTRPPAAAPPRFAPPTRAAQEATLRTTARQLQGVFVNQLMQAMRATVPDDGLTAGGAGEATFRGMLDERLSEQWTTRLDGPHSLAEALFRQLRTRLPAATGAGAPTGGSPATAADTEGRTTPEPDSLATR